MRFLKKEKSVQVVSEECLEEEKREDFDTNFRELKRIYTNYLFANAREKSEELEPQRHKEHKRIRFIHEWTLMCTNNVINALKSVKSESSVFY